MTSPPDLTTVRVTTDGAVGLLLLDRPDKLNPLGATTLSEIIDGAAWFDTRPEVKAVVVAGAGRAFSAGADLAAFTGVPDADGTAPREAADLGRRMADAVEAMRAVTVAAVHGHCIGGGLVLAAACDLRVAAEDTVFAIPEVDLGIPLAWGGIPRLVREIGPAMTRELVMTCRRFGAAEARALGLLNRVVAPDRVREEADALAAEVAAKSTLTLTATNAAVNAALANPGLAGHAWADADALVTALHDPESRRVASAYLARVAGGGAD